VLGRHQKVARDGAHRVEHLAVDPARAPHPRVGGDAGDGLDHALALGGEARLRGAIRRGPGQQQRRDRESDDLAPQDLRHRSSFPEVGPDQ
jgi:hypothetical protein